MRTERTTWTLRRSLAAITALGVMTLGACGGDDEGASPSPTTGSPATTASPAPTVAPTTTQATTTTAPTTTTTEAPKVTHDYPRIEPTTTFAEIAAHPAFEGFGPYMDLQEAGEGVELTRNVTVELIGAVRDNWDTQTMLDGLNLMVDLVNEGETVFYPLYTDEEIADDPSKATAGMFFVAGDPGAPLAVVAPGGGLGAVVSIQEGFPHAVALHDRGYNVAILKYRIVPDIDLSDTALFESAQANAADDLGRALELLDERGVDLDGYSVWGSSAGGGIVLAWGADGPLGAEDHDLELPATVVGAYPAPWFEPTADFPPTYVVMAEDDDTIPVARVDDFVDELVGLGVTVEYQRVASAGHGFGVGVDTDAAGWVELAADFWDEHRNEG